MKLLKPIFLVALGALIFSSCVNTQESVCDVNVTWELPQIEFDAEGIPLKEGCNLSYVTTAGAIEWQVMIPSDCPWVHATPTKANGRTPVKFTVDPNPYTDPRQVSVGVKVMTCDGISSTIVIKQAGKSDVGTFSVAPTALNFAADNDSEDPLNFQVTVDAKWTALLGGPNAADFAISANQGNPNSETGGTLIEVNATAPNTMAVTKTAQVMVQAGSVTRTVNLKQAAAAALLNVTAPVEFDCLVQKQVLNVTTNVPNGNVTAEPSADWVTITFNESQNKATLAVTENVATEDRSCTIEFTAAGDIPSNVTNQTITVQQKAAGKVLNVTNNSLKVSNLVFSEEAGTQKVEVATNADATWTATLPTEVDWCILSPNDGTGAGSFNVSVLKHENYFSTRTAVIAVEATFADGNTLSQNVTVTQDKGTFTLTVSPSAFTVPAVGGTYYITYVTNGKDLTMKATSSEDWLQEGSTSCKPEVGNIFHEPANNRYRIVVPENIRTEARSTVLTITATAETVDGSVSKSGDVQINQAGSEKVTISALPSELVFSSELDNYGKSVTVKANNHASITASINHEGKKYFAATQSTDPNIFIVTTLLDNEMDYNQTGILTLTAVGEDPENNASIDIDLTQLSANASTVSITPSVYAAPVAGIKEKTFTVTTNSEAGWKMYLSENDIQWITATPNGANIDIESTPGTVISGVNHDGVALTFAANETAKARSAEIRIEAGTGYTYLTITQEAGAVPTLTTDKDPEMTIPAAIGQYGIKVTANADWVAHVDGGNLEDGSSWLAFKNCEDISFDPATSIISGIVGEDAVNKEFDILLVATENTNIASRKAELSFTIGAGDYVKIYKLIIIQEGAEAVAFSTDPEGLLSFECPAGMQFVKIFSNTEWKADIFVEDEDFMPTTKLDNQNIDELLNREYVPATGDSWLRLVINPSDYSYYPFTKTANNAQDGIIKVSVEANYSYEAERCGYILFSVGTDPSNMKYVTLYVQQAARDELTVTEKITAPANGGSFPVLVTIPEDAPWGIDVTPFEWLEPEAGDDDIFTQISTMGRLYVSLGSQSFYLNVGKNLSKEPRKAVVSVNTFGGDNMWTPILNQTKQITIEQEGAEQASISLGNTSYQITAAAQAITPSVLTNTDFVVETAENWIEVDETNKNLSISSNDTGTTRSGTVIYKAGSILEGNYAEAILTITQLPHEISVETSKIEVPAGGMSSVGISILTATNSSWTATTYANWITIPTEEGQGNSNLLINVAENTSSQTRYATIAINGEGCVTSVVVSQEPHSLSINLLADENIDFGAQGGETAVQVTSTDTWSASISESDVLWLTLEENVDRIGNATFRIIAAANDSGKEREATIIIEGTQTSYIYVTQSAINTEMMFGVQGYDFTTPEYDAILIPFALANPEATWKAVVCDENKIPLPLSDAKGWLGFIDLSEAKNGANFGFDDANHLHEMQSLIASGYDPLTQNNLTQTGTGNGNVLLFCLPRIFNEVTTGTPPIHTIDAFTFRSGYLMVTVTDNGQETNYYLPIRQEAAEIELKPAEDFVRTSTNTALKTEFFSFITNLTLSAWDSTYLTVTSPNSSDNTITFNENFESFQQLSFVYTREENVENLSKTYTLTAKVGTKLDETANTAATTFTIIDNYDGPVPTAPTK